MAKIKFLTDSAADIPQDKLALYPDIEVIPFPIMADGKEILDRVTMTASDFYAFLDQCKELPTHAQITPFQFGEIFFKAWKDGYTHLIYTAINSKGSGTYQNAQQQANSFFFENPAAKGKFELTIIDSHSYTAAYGYPVVQGAKMAQEGCEVEEIVTFIEKWVEFSKILFVPFSLKYAKRSGRVSAAAAFVGEALGMRPVMTFKDGDSKLVAKVRGDKNVVNGILDVAEDDFQPGAPYCILTTKESGYDQQMIDRCTKKLGAPPEMVVEVGGVISINAGTNVLGISYRKRDEDHYYKSWQWNYSDYKEPELEEGYIR